MEAPKTKTVVDFLKGLDVKGRVLFLGEGTYTEVETEGKVQRVSVSNEKHDHFIKSMRNLPKTDFMLRLTLVVMMS